MNPNQLLAAVVVIITFALPLINKPVGQTVMIFIGIFATLRWCWKTFATPPYRE